MYGKIIDHVDMKETMKLCAMWMTEFRVKYFESNLALY